MKVLLKQPKQQPISIEFSNNEDEKLRALQALVGGYIEVAHVVTLEGVGQVAILCDEDYFYKETRRPITNSLNVGEPYKWRVYGAVVMVKIRHTAHGDNFSGFDFDDEIQKAAKWLEDHDLCKKELWEKLDKQ